MTDPLQSHDNLELLVFGVLAEEGIVDERTMRNMVIITTHKSLCLSMITACK